MTQIWKFCQFTKFHNFHFKKNLKIFQNFWVWLESRDSIIPYYTTFCPDSYLESKWVWQPQKVPNLSWPTFWAKSQKLWSFEIFKGPRVADLLSAPYNTTFLGSDDPGPSRACSARIAEPWPIFTSEPLGSLAYLAFLATVCYFSKPSV